MRARETSFHIVFAFTLSETMVGNYSKTTIGTSCRTALNSGANEPHNKIARAKYNLAVSLFGVLWSLFTFLWRTRTRHDKFAFDSSEAKAKDTF